MHAMQEYQILQGLTSGITRCPVLNVSDVIHALLMYSETSDWSKALDAALPKKRKQPPVDNKPKKQRLREWVSGHDPKEGEPATLSTDSEEFGQQRKN